MVYSTGIVRKMPFHDPVKWTWISSRTSIHPDFSTRIVASKRSIWRLRWACAPDGTAEAAGERGARGEGTGGTGTGAHDVHQRSPCGIGRSQMRQVRVTSASISSSGARMSLLSARIHEASAPTPP